MKRRQLSAAIAGLLALGALPLPGLAQTAEFTRPLRIIVPYPPGGDADVFSRKVADKLKDMVGQPVLVENRPGGSGLIAWQALSSSPPDGHTLLLINFTQAAAPALFKSFPTDWYRQVTPLVRTHENGSILVTGPNAPFKTFEGMLAYARANPGKVNVGVVGKMVEMTRLIKLAGINITQVPYKGIAEVNQALIANDVQVAFNSVGFSRQMVAAGKMVPLAVGSTQRNVALPEVPAIEEKVPGFRYSYWFGFVAGGKTPAPLADRLSQALLTIVKAPEFQQYFRDQLSTVIAAGPKETADFIESETKLLLNAAREAGIAPE